MTIHDIPCRIKNRGYTCYVNTAIQCISWTSTIRDYFQNHDLFMSEADEKDIPCHLQDIIGKLYDPENKGATLKINGLLNALKGSSMNSFIPNLNEPNDLHEFLSVFLDILCDSIFLHEKRQIDTCFDRSYFSYFSHLYPSHNSLFRPYLSEHRCNEGWVKKSSNDDMMQNSVSSESRKKCRNSSFYPIVNGCLRSEIECVSCRKKNVRDEEFSTLMVSFPKEKKKDQRQDQKNDVLMDLIESNFREEEIKMRECDFCKQRSGGIKRQYISRMPKVLIIMIRRYDETGRKILNKIDIHEEMSISHLVGEELGRERRSIDYHCNQNNPSSFVYSLSSISCHVGSPHNGHYFAIGRDKKKNMWALMDDEDVRPIDIDSSIPDSSQFYVLFYEKME